MDAFQRKRPTRWIFLDIDGVLNSVDQMTLVWETREAGKSVPTDRLEWDVEEHTCPYAISQFANFLPSF